MPRNVDYWYELYGPGRMLVDNPNGSDAPVRQISEGEKLKKQKKLAKRKEKDVLEDKNCIRRLMKDIKELAMCAGDFPNVSAAPLEDNIYLWHANVTAPELLIYRVLATAWVFSFRSAQSFLLLIHLLAISSSESPVMAIIRSSSSMRFRICRGETSFFMGIGIDVTSRCGVICLRNALASLLRLKRFGSNWMLGNNVWLQVYISTISAFAYDAYKSPAIFPTSTPSDLTDTKSTITEAS